MNISELASYDIKISKNSITAKDTKTGKTKGVVRDIQNFATLPIRDQVQHSKIIKKIISENLELKLNFGDFYIKDKTIYHFVSEKSFEFYEILEPEKMEYIENLKNCDLLQTIIVKGIC